MGFRDLVGVGPAAAYLQPVGAGDSNSDSRISVATAPAQGSPLGMSANKQVKRTGIQAGEHCSRPKQASSCCKQIDRL